MSKDLAIETSEIEVHESEFRQNLMAFEGSLREQEGAFFGDTSICPLKHTFAPGIYVREIFIPAGTYIVGKIHKHAHPNFLMSGTVQVVTESGGGQELTGPLSMISPPGTKRALRAITDLVWITVHHNPTNTQDIAELERIVIADSYEDYQKFVARKENRILKFLNKVVTSVQLKLIRQ